MIRILLGAACALAISAAGAQAAGGVGDDYPTADKADYIFGCMASNGQTRESLDRCACSIDTIASILPYSEYEAAATVLSLNKVQGQMSEAFRNTPELKDKVANMRRAQAEAEIKCFP